MPSSRSPLHQVAIVGAFNARQARVLEGETSLSITLEAVRGALADAGLEPREVDGVNITIGSGYPVQPPDYRMSAYQLLGGGPSWEGAQLCGIDGVLEAAAAIAAGVCETVVIANGQAGAYRQRQATAPWTRPANEFVECWGLYTAAEFALVAMRHMHLFGTQPEHLAEVASAIRTHGSMNPAAVYHDRGSVTPQDVLESRLIAEPFHLLDCAATSEGGAGLVVTTLERARDLPGRAVYVLGGGREMRAPPYRRPPVWEEFGWVGEWAAARAFEAAGIRPDDVDVCELYDAFSFEVIHQFEAFGFCGKGEGGPFVMDGRIRLGGQFPTATDGGTLSYGHFGEGQLLQKVIAGVEQLRSEAGARQVPGARTALVSNHGHTGRSVLLLSGEPV